MNDQPPRTEQQPEDPRVRFAAERTLLAWMRTGLALMGFGFVVARFGLFLREIAAAGQVVVHLRSTGWSLWIGTALIGLGVAVSLLASFEYYRFVSFHNTLEDTRTGWEVLGRSWASFPSHHCQGRIPFSVEMSLAASQKIIEPVARQVAL